MITCAFLLHALSPLHAGTGHAVDIIDLPIARMKATGIPFVPGSSVKGVLRDTRGRSDLTDAAFGPERRGESDGDIDFAGALTVGDARLLLLPVRSFRGTFAYVTSPLLLRLARRDLREAGIQPVPDVPAIAPHGARVASLSACVNLLRPDPKGKVTAYLEDLDLEATEDRLCGEWASLLLKLGLFPADEGEPFRSRLLLLDDESMTFLWETATQVDTRVRINPATGVVDKGALWTEESLPPESVLLGLSIGQRARGRERRVDLEPRQVLDHGLGQGEQTLQFGGKATVGRGRCRLIPVGGQP